MVRHKSLTQTGKTVKNQQTFRTRKPNRVACFILFRDDARDGGRTLTAARACGLTQIN